MQSGKLRRRSIRGEAGVLKNRQVIFRNPIKFAERVVLVKVALPSGHNYHYCLGKAVFAPEINMI
jgi:hypothetical protein